MIPRGEQSEDDEDEFFYSLNRRSAQKQDAPFSGWTTLILLLGCTLIPISVTGVLLAFGASLGAALWFALLLIGFNLVLVIFTVLLGTLTFASIAETLRQIFKPRPRR